MKTLVVASVTAFFLAVSPPYAPAVDSSEHFFVAPQTFVSATVVAFQVRCESFDVSKPPNGIDAYVLPLASGDAGRRIQITWQATVNLAREPNTGAGTGGDLLADIYGAGCDFPSKTTSGGNRPGTFFVDVPAGGMWLVLHGFGLGAVSFSARTV